MTNYQHTLNLDCTIFNMFVEFQRVGHKYHYDHTDFQVRNHIITYCKKWKKNHNLQNPYIILATFWICYFNPFSSFNDDKYCNKWITTCENDNVQCNDQEESKLNSIINANSGAHTL